MPTGECPGQQQTQCLIVWHHSKARDTAGPDLAKMYLCLDSPTVRNPGAMFEGGFLSSRSCAFGSFRSTLVFSKRFSSWAVWNIVLMSLTRWFNRLLLLMLFSLFDSSQEEEEEEAASTSNLCVPHN